MKTDRVLLVTGASSDVGSELIKRVHGGYGAILCHYNSSQEAVNSLKRDLGDKIVGLRADLSEEEDAALLIERIKESGKYPDHIVHLASPKTFNEKFHKCRWDDYARGLDISLRSIVMILEEFIPIMMRQKYGKIVFMLTSYVIGVPPRFQSPYITVKYALYGLMKNLAAEYADKGITVNAVSPEMMETRFVDSIPRLIIEGNAKKMPIGRNLIVGDVVPAFEYLLSDGADVVTGQNIGISGGLN